MTILITGAFGTLGRAVAEHFIGTGGPLALVDRAPAPADLRSSRDGGPHRLWGGVDLGDASAVDELFARVAREQGPVQVLVNVAGGFRWARLEDGGVEAWDAMYEINLRTAVNTCRAALPQLVECAQRQGDACIVNVGAGAAARAATAGMGAYTASKAGVARLTESLADELKDRGVRVNAVLPGTIDTPQNRRDMPDADASRWVAPRDLAAVIGFLASPAARAVTGAAIAVNGRA